MLLDPCSTNFYVSWTVLPGTLAASFAVTASDMQQNGTPCRRQVTLYVQVGHSYIIANMTNYIPDEVRLCIPAPVTQAVLLVMRYKRGSLSLPSDAGCAGPSPAVRVGLHCRREQEQGQVLPEGPILSKSLPVKTFIVFPRSGCRCLSSLYLLFTFKAKKVIS